METILITVGVIAAAFIALFCIPTQKLPTPILKFRSGVNSVGSVLAALVIFAPLIYVVVLILQTPINVIALGGSFAVGGLTHVILKRIWRNPAPANDGLNELDLISFIVGLIAFIVIFFTLPLLDALI